MIIPFEQLSQHEFALREIHVICQRPSWRQMNVSKRVCNGFVYLTKGRCSFSFAGQSVTMTEGALIYLPLMSNHVFRILSDEIEFYRVNFKLSVRQENVLFSDRPVLLAHSVPVECGDAIRALEEISRLENDTVRKTEKLCGIFSALRKTMEKPCSEQLAPAIHYLQQNMSQRLNAHYLASMCYLSTTQFYQFFRTETGMTPLQYRNKLLLDRAVMLLKYGGISVNETAQILGFSDPAYFSRFFKKHMGCAPKYYTGEEQLCR